MSTLANDSKKGVRDSRYTSVGRQSKCMRNYVGKCGGPRAEISVYIMILIEQEEAGKFQSRFSLLGQIV